MKATSSANLSIKQVRAFLHVAECRHYAEAAEQLHISQPALSISIRNLETQVGGELFNRSNRKVTLTPEGTAFLPVARRLLRDWEEAFADLNNLFSLQKGKLAIAVMPSFANTLLPQLLLEFNRLHPNISISVQDVVMETAMLAVQSARAELAITFEADSLHGMEFMPLFADSFMLICPTEHSLSSSLVVSWDDIAQFPFVAMNRGSTVRRWIDAIADANTLNLNITAEVEQLVTVGQLVAAGLGVSVVPSLCKPLMQASGLMCITIQNSGLCKQVGILTRSRSALSVAAEAFCERVRLRFQQGN